MQTAIHSRMQRSKFPWEMLDTSCKGLSQSNSKKVSVDQNILTPQFPYDSVQLLSDTQMCLCLSLCYDCYECYSICYTS